MKRFHSKILVWYMIILIAGCKNFHGPTEPIYTSSGGGGSISVAASDWEITNSYKMSGPPSPSSQGGWYVDLPNSGSGLLGYVQTPYRATGLQHKTLIVTFEVESDAATQYDATGSGDSNPAYMCLFIERRGDTLYNDNYRWWAGDAQRYQLGSADNRRYVISAELSYQNWTNVRRQTSPAEFEATLNDLGNVGITFGGASFYGHGVSVRSGHARVHVIEVSIR